MSIKIGTRASKLALIQTEIIMNTLQKAYPSYSFEIVTISTKGDQIQNQSLQKIGDKGIFVTEIENQLMNHSIDLAIHSMKDLPSLLPEELTLTDIFSREDARDVLILPEGVKELKENAIIGTGSIRRKALIQRMIPTCTVKDIRGNIDTRLRKLDEGQYDAIILASAGIKRIGLEHRIYQYLDTSSFIPACCQGAIAIECRKEDKELIEAINKIANKEDTLCALAERNFLSQLDGNCHLPMGGYCQKQESQYIFHGLYGLDEQNIQTVTLSGQDPMELSFQASQLLKENR